MYGCAKKFAYECGELIKEISEEHPEFFVDGSVVERSIEVLPPAREWIEKNVRYALKTTELLALNSSNNSSSNERVVAVSSVESSPLSVITNNTLLSQVEDIGRITAVNRPDNFSGASATWNASLVATSTYKRPIITVGGIESNFTRYVKLEEGNSKKKDLCNDCCIIVDIQQSVKSIIILQYY